MVGSNPVGVIDLGQVEGVLVSDLSGVTLQERHLRGVFVVEHHVFLVGTDIADQCLVPIMVGPEFFTGLSGMREHTRGQKDEDPLIQLMKGSPVSAPGRLPGPSDLTDRPRIPRRLARLMGTVRNTQQRTPRKHKNSTNHRKKTPEPRTKKQT